MSTQPLDSDALRAIMIDGIPFNSYLGLRVGLIGDGTADVTLPDRQELRNHVGSQHAGALLTAADVAAGSAMLGLFKEELRTATPLVRRAAIDYRRVARGEINARAIVDADADELLRTFRIEGRVVFPVAVELYDASGVAVADAVLEWHIRRNA